MRVISKDLLGYDREEEEEMQNQKMLYKGSTTQMVTQAKISDKDALKATMTLLDLNLNGQLNNLDYVENFFND